jgi:hypothetical protein
VEAGTRVALFGPRPLSYRSADEVVSGEADRPASRRFKRVTSALVYQLTSSTMSWRDGRQDSPKGPTHLHGFYPILQLANSLIVKPLALYLAVHGCFRLKVLSVALALFELNNVSSCKGHRK